LLRAPSNLAWNVSRDRASTTSLGNLGQFLTPSVQKTSKLVAERQNPTLLGDLLPSFNSLNQQKTPLFFSQALPCCWVSELDQLTEGGR